jgi:hypothetical protein
LAGIPLSWRFRILCPVRPSVRNLALSVSVPSSSVPSVDMSLLTPVLLYVLMIAASSSNPPMSPCALSPKADVDDIIESMLVAKHPDYARDNRWSESDNKQ